MSGSINAALLSLNRPAVREDFPLKVKAQYREALEHHEMYYGVSDDEVIAHASKLLPDIKDRATAVAVLRGPYGL